MSDGTLSGIPITRRLTCVCEATDSDVVVVGDGETSCIWPMSQAAFDRVDFRPRTGMRFDVTHDLADADTIIAVGNVSLPDQQTRVES